MKIKRLFSIVALGLFGVVSAAAGLSMRKEAEPAKADGDFLYCVTLDLEAGDCEIPTYAGFDASSIMFKCWNSSNYDSTVREFGMHLTCDPGDIPGYVFQVITKFEAGYSADIIQFRYTESSGQKWSTTYAYDISASNTQKSIKGFQWQKEWSGDSWVIAVEHDIAPTYSYDATDHYLTADPDNTRFIASNVTMVEGRYFSFSATSSYDKYTYFLDEPSRDNVGFLTGTWADTKDGTFDVILENSYSNGGVLRLNKYEEKETYIYYVTNSHEATTDYIYSWGGSEQFGSFPGTSIAKLVEDKKAREVTGNGVLHFQGSETPKLIYKINIDMGYPVGDSMFMFNNGTDEYKSDERAIVAENVYWWTGPANANAKFGLEFLITVEAYRNSREDYSVCNIDADSAAFLVGQYNTLPEDSRVTYVDTSTVYTWTDSTKTAEGLISYRQVMIQLGKIGGVAPVGSSLPDIPAFYNDTASNNAAIAIIIITSCLAITAVGVLLIVKKKRHN